MAKPLIPREEYFYKNIKNTPLCQCLPIFLGSTVYEDKKWLILQDLTANMSSPCIADIKLGTRSFEVDVSQEKANRQFSHIFNTTTASYAIRCIDICIRRNGEVVHHWDRKEGRQMTAKKFAHVLKTFLNGKRRTQFVRAIKNISKKLKETQAILPNMRLYSASVLAVYDGDDDEAPMNVKLIDFAHAYLDVEAEGGNSKDTSYDDNSIKGLKNLINFVNSDN
ncbi:inositol polyphosphate kinase family protein [Histomonas meleagridis]|uniref:inositol polyphosphate kinase family protein n=1 Tax=Histomonas meleagridis TaxID=135588 RepID=UPI00355A8C8C|nr:inositol polyphosphate kinase family protein [Histomonas meleagridis]KAH0798399.1 inositol polyphosphate kinase family protein [Histomonas meleagridis]